MAVKKLGSFFLGSRQDAAAIAYAVRSYEADGNQYADVFIPSSGSQWFLCPVVGGTNKVIGAPPDIFSGSIDPAIHPLVAIITRSQKLPPLVLDRISNPDIRLVTTKSDDEYHSDDPKDPSTEVDVRDHVIANGGSKSVMTGAGRMSLLAQDVLDLIAKGGVRISKDGASDGRIGLAGDIAEKLNKIIENQQQILAWIQGAFTLVPMPTGPPVAVPLTSAGGGVLPLPLQPVDPDEISASGITVPSKE